MMQVRVQLADGTQASINPGYNLRFYFPQMCIAVIKSILDAPEEDWVHTYLAEHQISRDEFLQAWQCLGDYLDAALDTEMGSPAQTLAACGFLHCREAVRFLIMAKLGQVLIASIWEPLREGSMVGERPLDVQTLEKLSRMLVARRLEEARSSTETTPCPTSTADPSAPAS